MNGLRSRYGAHPAHLPAILAGTGLAAIAAVPLLAERPWEVAGWFLAGALVHDLVVLPVYVGVDALLVAAWRRRPGRVWINFVRVPLALWAVLLLVWSPLITGRAEQFAAATGRSTDPYLGHWLAIGAGLALVSLAGYLARLTWVLRARR